jgi:hypothetical protein
MHTISRVAGIAAVTLSLALAACGGGGGGSVPAGGGTGGSGNTVTPLTHAQQKATMQSSVSAVQTLSTSEGALSVARHALAAHKGRRVKDTSSCSNSQITSDADNGTTDTETISTYYDTGCTELEEVEVVSVPDNASATSLTATGTITEYSLTGSVTSYDTLTIALTENSSTQATFTIEDSQANTVGGAVVAQAGTTCVDTEGTSSDTISCGAASVQTSGATQTGASLLENGASTSSSVTISLTASAYTAASGLGIAQGTSPAWNVTGGSPVDTITGSITTSSTANTATITLSDTTTGVSISGTLAGGTITLTESQNGKTLATATVNASTGNGTISYADGTTATIVNWTVEG